jgi:hypothetical protein
MKGEAPTTAQHEKWANGFEQYLREGVAPSRDLVGVFAKFKAWLLDIYQTIKALGDPITPDIRGVFDRLLSAPESHTVIAPESERGRTLADFHEADAAETPVSEAEAAADSGRSEPVAGGGGVGVQPGEERSRAAAERASGAGAATGRSDVAEPSKSGRPDPLPAAIFGPDDTGGERRRAGREVGEG